MLAVSAEYCVLASPHDTITPEFSVAARFVAAKW
jgi:hypothetical protein